MSKLRQVKMAALQSSSLATLIQRFNDFTANKALSAVESGTVAYPAGTAGERTVVDQTYSLSDVAGSALHVIVIFYIE